MRINIMSVSTRGISYKQRNIIMGRTQFKVPFNKTVFIRGKSPRRKFNAS